MSCLRTRVGGTIVLALSISRVGTAQTLDPPTDVPVRVGPLSLTPVIRLDGVGRDDNVYHDADNRTSDFRAALRPRTDLWLRMGRARLSARSELDYVYFRRLDELRTVDTVNAARLDAAANRLAPFVAGTLSRARHRRNNEIDAFVRRRDETITIGTGIRLTDKTLVEIRASRSSVRYEEDAVFLDSNLAQALNRRATGEGFSLRYALTPLTTLSLDVDRERDRFDFATVRNSDSLRIGPAVEFKPFALISGRAYVGFRERTFHDPAIPKFTGTAARVDLTYTLLGRTSFNFAAERDLAYSYRQTNDDYVNTDLALSVNHRLAEPWDVGARVGRGRLAYRASLPGSPVVSYAERVRSAGAEVGYRLGHTRLGFHVDYFTRDSDIEAFRRYDRLLVSSSVTYTF